MVDIHYRLDVRDLTVVSCLFVCFLNKTLISIIVTARAKKDSNNMYFCLRLLTWIRIDLVNLTSYKAGISEHCVELKLARYSIRDSGG